MNEIKEYLDRMFEGLPKTKDVVEMKLNVLDHMSEKYTSLLEEGVLPAKAAQSAIEEFGDINEILDSLDIDPNNKNNVFLSNEEVDVYVSWRKKFAAGIATGVLLILIGVGLFPLLSEATSDVFLNEFLSIGVFFLLIALGVALFIIFGVLDSNNNPGDNISINVEKKEQLKQKQKQHKVYFAIQIALGVFLIFIAMTLMYLFEYLQLENQGIVIFMSLIGIACFLFIFEGIKENTYNKLVKQTKQQMQQNAMLEKWSGVIMMCAVIIFLTIGFLTHIWHPTWIVFVIGGIACGIVNSFQSTNK